MKSPGKKRSAKWRAAAAISRDGPGPKAANSALKRAASGPATPLRPYAELRQPCGKTNKIWRYECRRESRRVTASAARQMKRKLLGAPPPPPWLLPLELDVPGVVPDEELLEDELELLEELDDELDEEELLELLDDDDELEEEPLS